SVFVTGAGGAVGSMAGQFARLLGASKVVGSAGGEEKCAWLKDECGFDEVIDYRTADVRAGLGEAFPDGIDLFFDNVGGETLNAVLGQIRDHARIVMCGAISNYDSKELQPGPANIINAISRRALLQGFIVLDHFDRAQEASQEMAQWLLAGRLQSRVDVTEGLEHAPDALIGLFTGANIGKTLVAV
nr:NADP-dependent oxidoreductase [Actinomycetes bacterium]